MTGIRDLLRGRKKEQQPPDPLAAELPAAEFHLSPAGEAYRKLKHKLHLQILAKVDLASLEAMPENLLRLEIANLVGQMLAENPAQINTASGACWCATSRTRCSASGPWNC